MNRILLFFCLLFGVYSCHTPSTTKTPPANIVSEFRITSTQVGAIRKGMTIKELYAALGWLAREGKVSMYEVDADIEVVLL